MLVCEQGLTGAPEPQVVPEYRFMRFRKAIEDVNVTIATYNDEFMGDQLVAPEMGIMAFDSGVHG